jgi:adenine nucleotide transporter 17
MNSAMFGIAVTNAVYYYWYEFVKELLQGPAKKTLSVSENMLTGAIAGAFTSILTNPIWVINVHISLLSLAFETCFREQSLNL